MRTLSARTLGCFRAHLREQRGGRFTRLQGDALGGPGPAWVQLGPKEAHKVQFFETGLLSPIGLLGPTESDSQVDSGSWVKKKSDSSVDSDSWIQTGSDSQVDSDSWVRTGSDSSLDSDSWTRARSDSGLDSGSWFARAWRFAVGPRHLSAGIGLGKEQPPPQGGRAGEVNGFSPRPWLLIIQT